MQLDALPPLSQTCFLDAITVPPVGSRSRQEDEAITRILSGLCWYDEDDWVSALVFELTIFQNGTYSLIIPDELS